MARKQNPRDWLSIVQQRVLTAKDRSTPGLRTIRRGLTRELAGASGSEVLDLVENIVLADSDIPQWIAYEIAHHHDAAMSRLNATRLNRLAMALKGWGDVDPFACYLAGPAWREGRVSNNHMTRWARSRNRWKRRSALVSTVPLNSTARGGTGDTDRTLSICTMLIDDRDDTIVKAMSWALRELAVKDASSVRRFIADNRQQLAARVVREVTNKLETGLKNPKAGGNSTQKRKGARIR